MKKSIRSKSIFLKDGRNRFALFDLFQRSPSVIRSQTIFLNDRRERFNHDRSFLKIKKVKRSKIERSNSQPWTEYITRYACYRSIVSRDTMCMYYVDLLCRFSPLFGIYILLLWIINCWSFRYLCGVATFFSSFLIIWYNGTIGQLSNTPPFVRWYCNIVYILYMKSAK